MIYYSIAFALSFLLSSYCDTFEAKVISVYDGDTITADIALGFDISIAVKIRLARINAPEMRGKEKEKGTIARDALRGKILDQTVQFKYLTKGKYGRAVGELSYAGENINDWMVKEGFAQYATY